MDASSLDECILGIRDRQPVQNCWLVREKVLLAGLCKRKILVLAGNTVHVNSARVRGLASISQPAALAEQAEGCLDAASTKVSNPRNLLTMNYFSAKSVLVSIHPWGMDDPNKPLN